MSLTYASKLAATADLREGMDDETFTLWVEIGKRLLHGQKNYGGFKFAEYDLDAMALEELEDLIVYRVAKRYLTEKDKFGKVTP